MTNKAIIIENLTKIYGEVLALDQVSFSVGQGKIHGFLGPNGAGKSTTLKIMANILKPTSGSVKILNENTTLGFLPEVPPLYSDMKVREFLVFVGNLYGLRGEQLEKNLQHTLAKVGLSAMADRLIMNLSKGYRQRVGMAQALIHNPPILILDEPTAGLDPHAIVEIRDLITELKKDHTVILSTHHLHEADLICDEITIINQGRILASSSKEDIRRRFSRRKLIQAECRHWSDQAKEAITNHPAINSIENVSQDESVVLNFYLNGEEDIRAELSEMLHQQKCGLLSFNQKELQLEDIFLQITKNGESL